MRRTYVSPSGNSDALLGIVGEQPGVQEIRAYPPRPFVGPAGQGLDECLVMAKILRRELYLTNVIKDLDAPLTSYINLDKFGRSTISANGYEYIRELGEELKSLNLNCVVALGNIALLALTNRIGITKWRGSILESTLVPGLKVIPTFHPATFIPPKFNFLNKPLIVGDLIKAKYESEFPEIRRQARQIHIRPSYEEAIGALNHCYEAGLRGQTIAFDIEVLGGEVDCFSVGWSVIESMCIPLRYSQGDYFNPDQELEILRLLAKIIQEERITKVGASFIFDTQFMFHKYGIRPRGILHCTQIAQKIMYPDFAAGLDFVTSEHTDVPYYKADGKQWMKMQSGSWETWWNYNGMDSIIPVEAIPKQIQILDKQGNFSTYERQRKLIEPLIYMSERGIRIDVQGMMDYGNETQVNLDKVAEELNSVVGYEINYNSPQQVMNYFYKVCGLRPYKKKNTEGQWVDTSDVDALKRIYRAGGPGAKAARLMLDIRSLSKRKSTYLNIGKVDKDGRYRSSYKPVGAETGRLSSGETIFGTGGNQQNWPHDLLRFFLFDEEYIGYSLDLSQIENRIVAYAGGVLSQIEAFESGVDLHKVTAAIIFNKSVDEISGEDGSSELGDGRQSERFWGKKGNHSINYDIRHKEFALKNELPEGEAKNILEKIHDGYPQIRGGYHAMIQNELKESRTVTNIFGRTRLFLGPIFPSHNTPLGACEKTYRESYAQFAQSTTADKMNEQGVEYVYYNQQLFLPVELLTQIHDSLVFQIPLSIPWIEHARMVLLTKHSLETPLNWKGVNIPTPVDVSVGFNLYKKHMKEFKSKSVPDDVRLFANLLQETYNELKRGRQ